VILYQKDAESEKTLEEMIQGRWEAFGFNGEVISFHFDNGAYSGFSAIGEDTLRSAIGTYVLVGRNLKIDAVDAYYYEYDIIEVTADSLHLTFPDDDYEIGFGRWSWSR
jgi:hypothetical protein